MSFIDFKEVTSNNAGSAVRYGGNDTKELMQILNGKVVSNRRAKILNEWLWLDHFDMKPPAVVPAPPTEINASRIYTDPTTFKIKVKKTNDTIIDIENVNIPDSSLAQITDKAKLPSSIAYEDEANTYGAFDQTFKSSTIKIKNPADTFSYIIAGSAIIAERIISLPLLTTNDTFIFSGATQTVSGTKNFINQLFRINNPASTASYWFGTSAITASRTVTLPLLTANDTFVMEAFGQTLSNKIIDAVSNTISNIGDTNIATHASSKITITNKAQLNSAIAYIDQTNTFASANTFSAAQTFVSYLDIKKISAPGNPALEDARLSVETVDANNNGLFLYIKQQGAIVKVRLYP